MKVQIPYLSDHWDSYLENWSFPDTGPWWPRKKQKKAIHTFFPHPKSSSQEKKNLWTFLPYHTLHQKNPTDLPSIKYSLRTFASVRASLTRKTVCFPWFFHPFPATFGSVNGPAAAIDFGVGFNQETCLAEASCWESSPRGFEKKGKASWHLRGQLCKKSWAMGLFLGGGKIVWEVENKQNSQKNICFKIDVRFFLLANFWKGKVRDL